MLRVAVILGSTRPNRVGGAVARWVFENASKRRDADFELIDVADLGLPLLDEPIPPSQHRYTKPHTKAWAGRVETFDAFVFVTAEYNHGVPGALKNAIDFLYREWNNKAAGFVSYGSAGGTRAVEHLRQIMAELQVADVRAQVALPLTTDFVSYQDFRPGPNREAELGVMLDQVIAWGSALRAVRVPEQTGRAWTGAAASPSDS